MLKAVYGMERSMLIRFLTQFSVVKVRTNE